MDKTILSMTLPKVGDKLFRLMYRGRYEPYDTYCPESCTVAYVNEKKGWYEVCFDETGIKECYKVPSFDHYFLKDKPVGGVPIICLENGNIYGSITECARDMKLNKHEIWKQIDGRLAYCSGYHFATVL